MASVLKKGSRQLSAFQGMDGESVGAYILLSASLLVIPCLPFFKPTTRTSNPGTSHVAIIQSEALNPQWYGFWRSLDGRTQLEFKSTGLLWVEAEHEGGQVARRVKFDWVNRGNEISLAPGRFSYSGAIVTLEAWENRFDRAYNRHISDPNALRITFPDEAQHALETFQKGRYRVVAVAFPGEGIRELLNDGEHILELSETGESFSLRLFVPIPPENQQGSSLKSLSRDQS